ADEPGEPWSVVLTHDAITVVLTAEGPAPVPYAGFGAVTLHTSGLEDGYDLTNVSVSAVDDPRAFLAAAFLEARETLHAIAAAAAPGGLADDELWSAVALAAAVDECADWAFHRAGAISTLGDLEHAIDEREAIMDELAAISAEQAEELRRMQD